MRFRINRSWYMCPLLKMEDGTSDNKKMVTLVSKPTDIYSATVNNMGETYCDVTLHFMNDTELNPVRLEMIREVLEILEP